MKITDYHELPAEKLAHGDQIPGGRIVNVQLNRVTVKITVDTGETFTVKRDKIYSVQRPRRVFAALYVPEDTTVPVATPLEAHLAGELADARRYLARELRAVAAAAADSLAELAKGCSARGVDWIQAPATRVAEYRQKAAAAELALMHCGEAGKQLAELAASETDYYFKVVEPGEMATPEQLDAAAVGVS